jgi:tetratricopeptide (TPR) repeat protein
MMFIGASGFEAVWLSNFARFRLAAVLISYRQALVRVTGNASMNDMLIQPFGVCLQHAAATLESGRMEAHETWLEAAALLHPFDDGSLVDLLASLAGRSALPDALAIAESWVKLRPHSAAALYHLGCLFDMTGRHAEAIAPYRRAMTCDPDYPGLRTNLAVGIHRHRGDMREAFALLEEAVKADPRNKDAWINLCVMRQETHELERALIAGKNAAELAPDDAFALNAYSWVLMEASRPEEATAYAEKVCLLKPDVGNYRFNLAILLLAQRDYARGWHEFESRWQGPQASGSWPVFPKPFWKGEPLAGKTLLLWGEQGMGDLLQFCRLVPVLAERVHQQGGRIEWNAFPQMGALLERSLAMHVDGFTAGGGLDAMPYYDYHLPLLSIPVMFGLREDTIPSTPYLVPDEARAASWKARLAGEKRLKVGLVWTGGLTHNRNPFRRVGWERYADHLKQIPGVAFYSLQKGAGADVSAARAAGLHMEDFTDELHTFDDTAALISALDLVITVCTSMSHLSGALGRPTWVLLDVNPYWVWQRDREDSPWYPTAKLYRQPEFAQWEPVMHRVANDLTQLAHRPSAGQ